MSNEENSIVRFGDDTITALNFIPATNYVLAPHGSPIWQGSADDLAALVRDARRFRRMEKAHGDTHCHDGWGTIQKFYCAHPIIRPLAEIADALPEVEG